MLCEKLVHCAMTTTVVIVVVDDEVTANAPNNIKPIQTEPDWFIPIAIDMSKCDLCARLKLQCVLEKSAMEADSPAINRLAEFRKALSNLRV